MFGNTVIIVRVLSAGRLVLGLGALSKGCRGKSERLVSNRVLGESRGPVEKDRQTHTHSKPKLKVNK